MSYIPLFYIYLYYSVRNTHLLYCYSQLDSRKVTFVFIYFLKPMKGEMSIDGRKSFLFSHIEIVCQRVRPLVLAVKKWARDKNINDASDNTLSSYALALMVIFFLQCGVSPAVLPCLQDSHPHLFPPERSPWSLRYEVPHCARSLNTQSLGQLYRQFFHFYSHHSR